MSDITKRLLEACTGHPAAEIPWPHRLLHEAVDVIQQKEAKLAELREYSIKMENYLETVDKTLMAHGLNIRFSIPNRPLSALLRQEVEGE